MQKEKKKTTLISNMTDEAQRMAFITGPSGRVKFRLSAPSIVTGRAAICLPRIVTPPPLTLHPRFFLTFFFFPFFV
ncbi:hypothetical protein V8C44DRAFT_337991 [Trichoderma aethiopicum]